MEQQPANPIRGNVACAAAGTRSPQAEADFDGIICFGGVDWWYHNRGHYDIQMMRELSARVPVLYVNSIGMRTPKASEGRVFLKRVARKLKSLRHGFVPVRENFTVFSPATLPGGGRGRLGAAIARMALSLQVRRAAKKAGITKPILWVACPPGVTVLDDLRPVKIVYQRTDRFENFHGVNPKRIKGFDNALKDRADLVLFCSRELFDAERDECRDAAFIDHGVDFDRFEQAGTSSRDPDDVAPIARPRIGFVGGIDSHTFDPALYVDVARSMPDAQFVLVGGCSLADGWCDLPNVHHLGRKPYDQVADYMASFDVLIMPWNQSDWIRACNPVKMKEYLAVGRPVVSTWFPEVERYRDHIAIAIGPDEFVACIRHAIESPGDPEPGRKRVESHTWQNKASEVWDRLQGTCNAHRRQRCRRRHRGWRRRCRLTTRRVNLCVLLAGGLKPSPLAAAAGCSVLDLTADGSKTIMEHWIEHLAPLGSEDAPLQVRIMHGSRLAPTAPPDHATPALSAAEHRARNKGVPRARRRREGRRE